jgi:hypothetical protein
MTVHESLTRLRLEHAAELICAGVKVEAVALTVGYRSKKNFYVQFKRRFETTPEQYGLQHRATPATTSPVVVEAGGMASSVSTSIASMSRHALDDRRLIQATQLAIRFGRATLRVAVRRFADSSLAMLLTNDVGKYVAANRAAVSLTHYRMIDLRDLSPKDVFSKAPAMDARCLWQTVLPTSGRSANAILRSKESELVSVHVINVKNLLWGHSEMSSLLA